jgi:ParB/RepB/Spo0J family partition protein
MTEQTDANGGSLVRDHKAEAELQRISLDSAALNQETQPTSARVSAARNIMRAPISEIVVGVRLRELDDEKVREIAESMAQTGQGHAITVRQVGDQIMLVAGRHRLEAAKVLGWQDIDAKFMASDDIDAQLWEIAENLFRAELTVLERSAHVAKYVELVAVKDGQVDHPVAGGKQPKDKGISRAARELPIAGQSEEARRKEITRALDIDAICPDAKAAAKAAGVDDNQQALLKIAKQETAELQVKKANEVAPGKRAATAGASGKKGDSSIKSEIDALKPASKLHIDQSKQASIAALVEFAKFVLPRVVRQGNEIALTLTADEDVKQFNTLANRAQKVIGGVSLRKN